MEKAKRLVLVFTSVHFTLKAETFLQSAKWPFLVIPIPPAISEGCGLGIQIDPADQLEVEAFLKQHEIVPLKAVIIT